MVIYTGFSSRDWHKNNASFTKTDIDIIKEDLLNHIYTEYGERVHMPGFGTRIPSLVFEQLDQETCDIVEEDLLKVFNYDPRVEILSLQVYPVPNHNLIVAIAELKFIELNMIDKMELEFNAK
jgi:phage baseplate assembly protein W